MRKLVGVRKIDQFPIYDIEVENDHCFELSNGVIAHNSLYPVAIVSGGSGIMYAANQVFVITKSQEKVDGELAGYNFTINIHKSRYVREKAKLPFKVLYDSGIQKWSAMFDLAIEAGFIDNSKKGWYSVIDPNTGEVDAKSVRAKDIETNDEFFEALIKNADFKEFVSHKFRLESSTLSGKNPTNVISDENDQEDEYNTDGE